MFIYILIDMSTDFELFKGKTLSDLFKDIYSNQVTKKNKISEQIEFVRGMIKNGGDLSAVGNILTDLIESSIKNDEQLVRLASVAQKIISSEMKGNTDTGLLSEDEKRQLLIDIDTIFDDNKKIDSSIKETNLKIDKL